MRSFLASVVLVLTSGLCLTGCGGSDEVASEPAASASTSASASASPSPADPTPARSDTGQTCVDLYHPPAQLMPRAVEFVHGRSAGDPVAEADEIVSGLSSVAATADPRLAADIAVVRIAVDTQRAIAQSGAGTRQDLRTFGAAARRLDQACATYGE